MNQPPPPAPAPAPNPADEQKKLEFLLRQIVDGSPVPTFVINSQHRVLFWNRACERITGKTAREMIGTDGHRRVFYAHERPTMADLIVDGAVTADLRKHYGDKHLTRSTLLDGACEAEDFFPHLGGNGGIWLYFTAAPLVAPNSRVFGAIETLQDVSERHVAEEALMHHLKEQQDLAEKRGGELAEAQRQLIQSEKLASIGQLAAGVAHEINNPIGFVHSNLGSLARYFESLLRVLDHFEAQREQIAASGEAGSAWVAEIEALKAGMDLAYIKEDIPALLAESADGVERVRRIVQDLRDFSRVDSTQDWESADLRAGLDSTLNIVHNEIKYRADVVKEYGELPPVECLPAQLNQVFMNLLVNAAQAMPAGKHGTIAIRCGQAGDTVWVEIADNGAGIPPENLKKIFDPFFTTKPVGKGTGLGLSLSYGIVEKHGGRIEANSEVGKGTTFRIVLPVEQKNATEKNDGS